jgi:group II intron reverse transcriptase/maturase
VHRVWIPKSDGSKRGLGIPNVIDRIVQQAVLQKMSPHYEEKFHDSSHGFRPRRSCHTAIEESVQYLKDGAEWVVDIDFEKFFDTVNHDRLMARLGQRIEDKRILKLIRQMLNANVVMPDGVVVRNEEGTPQGGPLSPLLANIVLDELDWELERRGLNFVRYADDCNIYVGSERAGKRIMESIKAFAEKKLRLKVNVSKSAVAKPEDRHFLGFRLQHNADGGVDILISKRSRTRISEKIRELTPSNYGRGMRTCIKELNQYLVGWFGFFRIVTDTKCDRWHYFDAHIRRRLRALQIRQWGTKRVITRNLIKMGVKRNRAFANVYGSKTGRWRLSHSKAMETALSVNHFVKLGLINLVGKWNDFIQSSTRKMVQLAFNLG